MNEDKELLKETLQHLNLLKIYQGEYRNRDVNDLIKKINDHLDEPVAWMHEDGKSVVTHNTKLYGAVCKGYNIPLYEKQK